ncbi:MAG: hypothetical protein KJO50_10640, partial [Bacteroidia bacterium]|nr:hypothetical protein [Bacteroidia bacterium]
MLKSTQYLFFMSLIFLVCSCQKDDMDLNVPVPGSADTEIVLGASNGVSVQSLDDLQDWFENLVYSHYGLETGELALRMFDPKWSSAMTINESTIIVPCDKFTPSTEFRATRLFITLDDSNIPQSYFYDIVPEDQSKTRFNQEDRDYFDGKIVTYDIFDGYKDKLVYEDGDILDYFNDNNQFRLKCLSCYWWNLAPTETDGSTGGGGGSYAWPPMPNDRPGETLCLNDPCPNGFPVHQCRHNRIDCNTFPITIITIPGSPGFLIHDSSNDSSRDTRGNGPNQGGTGTGTRPGIGTGIDPKTGNTHIPVEALSEVECMHARTEAIGIYLDNNPEVDLTWVQLMSVLDEDDPCGTNQQEFETALELAIIEDACSSSNGTWAECVDFVTNFLIAYPGQEINIGEAIEDCFGAPDSNGNYIDCNSFSGDLTFTIYADQPVKGKAMAYNPVNKDVGHAFVSFKMTDGENNSNLVFGFYPGDGVIDPVSNITTDGAV